MYDGAMIDWLPYSQVSDYISSCERLIGLVDSEQVTLKHIMSCFCVYMLADVHLKCLTAALILIQRNYAVLKPVSSGSNA